MVETLAAALLISVLAAFSQSVTGFGFALVSVPLFALFLDPVTAIVATTIIGSIFSTTVAVSERKHIDYRVVSRVTIAAIIGMPVGFGAITFFSEKQLTVTIGVVLLLIVILLSRNVRLPSTGPSQWSAGIVSGALLTSTGMNGPPVVLVVDALGINPRSSRATLQAIFSVQDYVAIAGFIVLGLSSRQVGLVVLTGAIALPVGWYLGQLVFSRLSRAQFRKGVIAMLGFSAVLAVTNIFA